jgi:serine/threonine-protein kinase
MMTMSAFQRRAAALILSAAPPPAFAESWRSYHNDRFGQTAAYPADWNMEPEPANDDGRRFTSPDAKAFVTISGGFALDSPAEEMARRAEPEAGETVTYSAKGANWIVRSGTRGDRVFYRKSLLSCGGQVWNTLELDYPADEKQKYDKLAAHMAASLRPGVGYNITCK